MTPNVLNPSVSAEHPNAIRLGNALTALGQTGTYESLRAIVSPAMVAHIPGRGPHGGTWKRDDLIARMPIFGELSGGTFVGHHEAIIGNDDFVVLFNRVTASRNGRSLNQGLLEVWMFDNGLCVDIALHFEDVAEWDQFWA